MKDDIDYIKTAQMAHATWKKRRNIAGIRQEEIAEAVGMTQGRYSRLECNFKDVKMAVWVAIERILAPHASADIYTQPKGKRK